MHLVVLNDLAASYRTNLINILDSADSDAMT